MHSRDPGKSDAAFQEQFEAILKAARDGIADFSAFVFPSANYRKRVFVAICIFDSATFTRDVHFDWVTFTQYTSFIGTTFMQNAHFTKATFMQNAPFGWATFTQNAHFDGATFTQNADFDTTTFTRDAYFGWATFTQEAIFREAKFLGSTVFRETKFGGEYKDGKERAPQFLPGPVFSLAEFSQPEKILFYKTYLGQALFHNCDVSKVTFSSVEWREREGKRMVFEEEVDLASGFAQALRPAEGSLDERNYGLIAELYQQLKKNYDERKDYWTAGDFHYGESYVRPALWFGATLFFFALLYPLVGLHDSTRETAGITTPPVVVVTYSNPLFPGQPAADRHKAQWRLFGKSLLTALETAAFQKEPFYKPVGARGRVLTLLETLLTSTLAALFLLAVRRQFRR